MKISLHSSFPDKRLERKNLLEFLLLLFLLAAPALLQAQEYQWNNVTIGGGGFVSAIIPSQAEAGLVYARTDVGGAYRWDPAQEKWIPLLDWVGEDQVGYLGVESLATDPREPNKLYMLVGISYFNGGKTAILRSDDYGQTFSITDVTPQFKAHGNGMGRQNGEKLVIDANKPNILFAGTRWNGLFKSTDSGVSWAKVESLDVTTTPNENGISFVLIDSTSSSYGTPSQTIFAGVSRSGNNLYMSDNGGETFSPVSGSPDHLMPQRAVLSGDGHLYITYANGAGPHPHWAVPEEEMNVGKIMKYNITTGEWTDVTPSGITAAFGGISVDPENPQRIIASTINQWLLQESAYGDHFYLSTNGGASWTNLMKRGFELDENGFDWISDQSIHWAGSIEFDPFNPQKVWVTSGNGIYTTEDISATPTVWKFNVPNLEETVPLNLLSIANGPVVSVIGDYDGFVHRDVNQPGRPHKPGMGTTTGLAYAALNPEVMARYGDEMYYSTDMGESWEKATHKGNKGQVAISADGTTFLHAPQDSDITYYSTDLGANWKAVSGLKISSARPVADPVNPDKFYAYNPSTGKLLVSQDKGLTFQEAGSTKAGGSKVIRTVFGREGHLLVALNEGGLARSTDSGKTFNLLPDVSYAAAVGVGKQAPGSTYPTLFIWGTVNGQVGLYRSIDEGASWTRINDDAHEFGGPGNGQFVVGDRNIFGRVYMSTAGRGIVYGQPAETCIPTFIEPQMKIGEGEMQSESFAVVGLGETILLSPAPTEGGEWSWAGPNGFSSESREVRLENIQQEQGGIYTATFTNASGCTSAAQTFAVVVNEKVTGIKDQSFSNNLKVFPNPSNGQMTIDFNGKGYYELQIIDYSGRVVVREEIKESAASIVIETEIPAGIYLLQLKGLDKSFSSRILIN